VRRIVALTALAAMVTVIVLLLADGVVEVVAFEVIVAVVMGAALLATGPLRPARFVEPPPITASLSVAKAPPQLQRLEWMVEFATTASADAELRLVPELRALAAARLQHHHHVDIDADRERAATLLGADAWAQLDPERPRRFGRSALSLDELDAIVTAIEGL
jgi:hypothetical protein